MSLIICVSLSNVARLPSQRFLSKASSIIITATALSAPRLPCDDNDNETTLISAAAGSSSPATLASNLFIMYMENAL